MSPGRGGNGTGSDGDGPPGDLACEEAVARVYEYLDGELDPDMQERMHRHLEACRACYPYFDFERHFLDHVHERGLSGEAHPRLRARVEALLEEVD